MDGCCSGGLEWNCPRLPGFGVVPDDCGGGVPVTVCMSPGVLGLLTVVMLSQRPLLVLPAGRGDDVCDAGGRFDMTTELDMGLVTSDEGIPE